ncbi:hypothetical protein ACPZ19_18120 [Amycolatopsis lurida]
MTEKNAARPRHPRGQAAFQEMRVTTGPRDDVVVKIDGSPEFVGT